MLGSSALPGRLATNHVQLPSMINIVEQKPLMALPELLGQLGNDDLSGVTFHSFQATAKCIFEETVLQRVLPARYTLGYQKIHFHSGPRI